MDGTPGVLNDLFHHTQGKDHGMEKEVFVLWMPPFDFGSEVWRGEACAACFV